MATGPAADPQRWDSEGYAARAGFVPVLGVPVLELLAPRPGELILDLGCGDGALTEKIVAAGARVVGVDSSPEMLEAARRRGLDARLMDGGSLELPERFDAVFSNAALHWMRGDPGAVVVGVRRHLRPGGRFVGEFGGHGNIAALLTAILAALEKRGVDGVPLIPWYFPTDEEYRALLEMHGFTVRSIALLPRRTPVPAGIDGWLATFAGPLLSAVPEGAGRDALIADVVRLLRPSLCDRGGNWIADYVRLRFAATV